MICYWSWKHTDIYEPRAPGFIKTIGVLWMGCSIWWLGAFGEPGFGVSTGMCNAVVCEFAMAQYFFWPYTCRRFLSTDMDKVAKNWYVMSVFSKTLSKGWILWIGSVAGAQSTEKISLTSVQTWELCLRTQTFLRSIFPNSLTFFLMHMALRCQQSAKSWRLGEGNFG